MLPPMPYALNGVTGSPVGVKLSGRLPRLGWACATVPAGAMVRQLAGSSTASSRQIVSSTRGRPSALVRVGFRNVWASMRTPLLYCYVLHELRGAAHKRLFAC